MIKTSLLPLVSSLRLNLYRRNRSQAKPRKKMQGKRMKFLLVNSNGQKFLK